MRAVFEQIRRTGRVRRGEIGVRAQTVTPTLAAGLGLKRDQGAVLADVAPGSPADRAGLSVGDLVLTLDGKPIENGRQLHVNLYRREVGDVVRLEVLRGEQPTTVTVSVAERADPLSAATLLSDPRENIVPRLGILGGDTRSEAGGRPAVAQPSPASSWRRPAPARLDSDDGDLATRRRDSRRQRSVDFRSRRASRDAWTASKPARPSCFSSNDAAVAACISRSRSSDSSAFSCDGRGLPPWRADDAQASLPRALELIVLVGEEQVEAGERPVARRSHTPATSPSHHRAGRTH